MPKKICVSRRLITGSSIKQIEFQNFQRRSLLKLFDSKSGKYYLFGCEGEGKMILSVRKKTEKKDKSFFLTKIENDSKLIPRPLIGLRPTQIDKQFVLS